MPRKPEVSCAMWPLSAHTYMHIYTCTHAYTCIYMHIHACTYLFTCRHRSTKCLHCMLKSFLSVVCSCSLISFYGTTFLLYSIRPIVNLYLPKDEPEDDDQQEGKLDGTRLARPRRLVHGRRRRPVHRPGPCFRCSFLWFMPQLSL